MNKALKTKWVKALCSGEYEQGKGVLKTTKGKYCCLGVLAEVGNIEPEDRFFLKEKDMAFSKQNELALMNDTGVPFEMIAGFINENL